MRVRTSTAGIAVPFVSISSRNPRNFLSSRGLFFWSLTSGEERRACSPPQVNGVRYEGEMAGAAEFHTHQTRAGHWGGQHFKMESDMVTSK